MISKKANFQLFSTILILQAVGILCPGPVWAKEEVLTKSVCGQQRIEVGVAHSKHEGHIDLHCTKTIYTSDEVDSLLSAQKKEQDAVILELRQGLDRALDSKSDKPALTEEHLREIVRSEFKNLLK